MVIRQATSEDVNSILAMSKKFYPKTSYASWLPLDDESVIALINLLVDSGIMLIAEEDNKPAGMIGLAVYPFMFNANAMAAGEIVFWVEPEYRARGLGHDLLQVAEGECRKAGVDYIQMRLMADSPQQAAHLYTEHGYRLEETAWSKVL